MAKREPELNGSRELIDYLNGDGPFSQKLVLEIVQLKSAYAHIYEGLQTLSRLGGTRHAEVLGAIDGMRRKNSPTRAEREEQWQDDGEITDVTDRETLRDRARIHRARNAKTRRLAQYLVGPVLVVGGVAWELVRAYVSR